jgi:two-component system sensor histidine kinase CiaH
VFRRLRYKIALQFTALVFVLMLVVGGAYIGVQYYSTHRSTSDQLRTDAALIQTELAEAGPADSADLQTISGSADGASVRVYTAQGDVLFAGDLFGRISAPMQPDAAARFLTVKGSTGYYRVYQVPVVIPSGTTLYVQIARPERIDMHELPGEVLLFVVVSLIITSLTFLFGLVFAKRSLAPAESMLGRLRQFTHDASHELRTPLAAANSSLDLAIRTGDYAEEIRAAKRELQQGSRLIERLLQLAELDELALTPEPVDLSRLVRDEVAQHQGAAADAGVELRSEVSDGMIVHCDESLVRQLLDNLLANAMKFTPAGGSVSVDLASGRLSVRDTGVGIPAASIPHVFERFYQAETSRSGEGSGLGLAIVARIVETHGWTIQVDSREGKGSVFTVDLSS